MKSTTKTDSTMDEEKKARIKQATILFFQAYSFSAKMNILKYFNLKQENKILRKKNHKYQLIIIWLLTVIGILSSYLLCEFLLSDYAYFL